MEFYTVVSFSLSTASAGTIDSSPSPVSGVEGASSSGLMVDGSSRMNLPRKSCSDIPVPHELLIANSGERQRKASTQMSDPPQQHRTPSPRPSISGGAGHQQQQQRRSIERAAISIIIDDADSSNMPAATALPTAAVPSGNGHIFVARLCRAGPTSGSNFTSGFGLTLSGRHSFHAVIARIEPHGRTTTTTRTNQSGRRWRWSLSLSVVRRARPAINTSSLRGEEEDAA